VPRPVDAAIPVDELLYRGIRPDDIDGDDVRTDAIDIHGMSVNRHKYNPKPEAAMNVARGRTRVASIRICDFPPPLKTDTGPVYQFQADDLPEEANPAHAEIRPIRVGIGWNSGHDIAPKNKRLLKEALASRMKVLPQMAPPATVPA